MAIRGLHSARETVVAAWKLLLSYRKRTWDLTDYPVVIRNRNTSNLGYPTPRLVQHRYAAHVVRWWGLVGNGNTPQDAMRDLALSFERNRSKRQREGRPLPRPGTFVPMDFAPQDRVKAHPELTHDFVRRVLGMEWAWVSDSSSLSDFHASETNDALNLKIKEVYGVDVSDIESGNLSKILDRIAATRS